MKKSTSGFTIVELLIVIVVIAILATISIVAYNGIQQRANNTAITSAASQAVRAISAYIAATGEYPRVSEASAYGRCLVQAADGGCTRNGNAIAVDSDAVERIATVAQLPSNIPSASPEYLGIAFEYRRSREFNGVNRPFMIFYSLFGENRNCELEGSANGGSTPAMSAPRAMSSNGFTVCAISVAGPAHS